MAPVSGSAGRGRPHAESWRHSSKLVATARAGPSEMVRSPPSPHGKARKPGGDEGAARPCFLWAPEETRKA